MTPDQCDEVMATLTAACLKGQNDRYNDASAAIWEERLLGLTEATAYEVVGLIIVNNEWFPTIAEFLACYQSVARRQALQQPALPAESLYTPPAKKDQVRDYWLPKIREDLATMVPKYRNEAGELVPIPKDARRGLAAGSLADSLPDPSTHS